MAEEERRVQAMALADEIMRQQEAPVQVHELQRLAAGVCGLVQDMRNGQRADRLIREQSTLKKDTLNSRNVMVL